MRFADRVEYHQCKRQRTGEGHWTLGALKSAKVLSAFLGKLGDPDARCVFASTHAADQLDELAERARRAVSVDEFINSFLASPEWHAKFESLCQAWGNPHNSIAFEALRRIYVNTIGEAELEALNQLQAEVILSGDIDKSVPVLTDILRSREGEYLAPIDLWRALEKEGYAPNPWRATHSLALRVEGANRRFCASREDTLINGSLIVRPEAEKLRSLVHSEPVVVIHGDAGVGKSDVLLQFVRGLEADDVPHLIVRLDRITPTLLPNSVGAEMDLPASPVVTLAAHARGMGVLVIDQLDIVSATSGRSPQFLDCVNEMVKLAASMPALRIVLSCRTFDLENDARLRRLVPADRERSVVGVGPLAPEQVLAAVEAFGFDPTRLSNSQKNILAIPLHLALVGEIATPLSRESRVLEFVGVGDLFEAFWDHKYIEVQERLGRAPAWTQVLDALCDFMSDRQLLRAPADIADQWASDLNAMISSHAITRDGPNVALFHEMFFDYVFARRFAGRQRTIAQLLARDQDLFRRAQVRQILAYNRGRGNQYLEDLSFILTDESVRFHLRDLVVAWLAQISPNEDEWRLLQPHLDDPESSLYSRAWRTVATPSWFTIADDSGYLQAVLASDDDARIELALPALACGNGQFLDRALELLSPHVGESITWTKRLLGFLQRVDLGTRRPAFDLLIKLLDRGDLDDTRGRELWYLTHGLPAARPAWANELLGHYLENRVAAASNAGLHNPFDKNARLIPSQPDLQEFICESAGADPGAFFEEVWPRLRRIIEVCLFDERDGRLRLDDIWPVRHIGVEHGMEDSLLAGAERAFQTLSRESPSEFQSLLDELSDTRSETIVHLMFEGFAANAAHFADAVVDCLVHRPDWLRVGWSNSSEWATRRLIEAITPHVSQQALLRLESLLLSYFTPWEKSKEGRTSYGYTQFALLGGVVPEKRTAAINKRLGEWRRKFHCDDSPPPQGIHGGTVQSPISLAAASKMSDNNWRKAIARYGGRREFDSRRQDFVGGAYELAHVLESETKADPVRFAKLATTLPDATDARYFDAVLRGVADSAVSISMEETEALLLRCHRLPSRPCGRWITKPLRRHPDMQLSDPMVELITWYATTDLDPLLGTQITDDGKVDERLLHEGLNSVRGAVAETLVHLIWQNQGYAERLELAIANLLSDPAVGVRAVAAQIVIALLKWDSADALEAFERLTGDASDELLATRYVYEFLRYRIGVDLNRLRPTVERMIHSSIGEAQMHGAALASLAALSDADAADLADVCLNGTEKQRLGAANVYGANLATSRFRGHCAQTLLELFNDDSRLVRDAAAAVIREFSGTELGEFADVAEGFVNSAAAQENWADMLDALVETTSSVPDLALLTCERVLSTSSGEGLQSPVAYRVDLVSQVLLRVYTDGTNAIRSRALVLIDWSLQQSVYGAQRALAEHDRAWESIT